MYFSDTYLDELSKTLVQERSYLIERGSDASEANVSDASEVSLKPQAKKPTSPSGPSG